LQQHEPVIVRKDGNSVVDYNRAMKADLGKELPILKSMFQKFNEVCFEEKTISTYYFIVIGQDCVAIKH